MVPDFGGYVTRYGVKCSDGRTILAHAFQPQDGHRIPLVYQHQHKEIDNVLGHLLLEHRNDGVYAKGFFNNTPKALLAKEQVQHKDLTNLSIYAHQLVQHGMNVKSGKIGEGSLVLSGANPGAYIDDVYISHGDGDDPTPSGVEVIIYTDVNIEPTIALEHSATPVTSDPPQPQAPAVDPIVEPIVEPPAPPAVPDPALVHATTPTRTTTMPPAVAPDRSIADIFNEFTDEQKTAVYAMIGSALDHSGIKEGDPASRNVFDQTDDAPAGLTLTHADVKSIMKDGERIGSLKEAAKSYALQHNIDSVDLLFPEARLLQDQPDFQKRRTEWVNGVLNNTRKSPFTRIKTILADITVADARAKGYIKGNMKEEEFFGVTKRTTTPTTVYKKQKLDRDDVLDITDFDVITWMKGEMRIMLDEEIARAILIGDGRSISDQDKVKDPAGASDGAGIRSILNDHHMYVTQVYVNVDDANSTADEMVDGVVKGMPFYRGTGMPVFYTTLPTLTKLLLAKDTLGRRLYKDKAELAAAMMVSDIVTVEPMEELTTLIGIVVNLQDYVIGTDAGGEVNMFDNFDIDFNALKYLIETRCSGALVKFKAALVINKTTGTNTLVDPITAPTMDTSTYIVTIPTQTGVTYKNADTGATITGAQAALTAGGSLTVNAVPTSGYYFVSDNNYWVFTRRA